MTNVLIGSWLLLIILIAAAFLTYYFYPAAFLQFFRVVRMYLTKVS